VDQSKRMTDLRRRVEPAVRLAQSGLPGQILGRLIEVQFLDRTVILAAQAFSAILPLFIVVSTVSPHPGGDSPATVLIGKLGLGPADMSSLQTAVVPPPSARASIGVLGVVLALLTATSFARALQRSYQLAWRLPPVGLRAAWRPLALVVGLALYIELLFLFGRLVRGVPAGSVLEDLVTFAGAWALWTGAGWILLAGRVSRGCSPSAGCSPRSASRRCAACPLSTCPAWWPATSSSSACWGWRSRCSVGCRRARSSSWWPRSWAPSWPRTPVASASSSGPRGAESSGVAHHHRRPVNPDAET
jgi:hypothetical protein